MVDVATIARLDLLLGTVAGIGLLSLLYSGTVVHYDRFFRVLTVGLLGYAVTGPVVGTLSPSLIHAVHGLATLAVAIGCYGLVSAELTQSDDFESIFGVTPNETDAPASRHESLPPNQERPGVGTGTGTDTTGDR